MLLVCSLLLRHMHLGTKHVATIVSVFTTPIAIYCSISIHHRAQDPPALGLGLRLQLARAKGLAPIEGPAWALWSVS